METEMNMHLTGKVAIVTGAASGIGRACAERLASKGAAVLVTDLQDQKGEGVARGIREAGGKAAFLHHDVTQEAAWIATIAAAKSQFGSLHILLNNAGIGRAAPLIEMSFETWRLQMAVNLDGMFLGMKHAIPLISQSGGGSIINVSSAAAMKAYPNMSAYCASKAGVKHLTKVAALECGQAKNGVRVNSLHPGIIETPAWDNLGSLPGVAPDLDAMAQASVPLGFKGVPDDIANCVMFLVSDESRYVTGAEFVVDGGMALQ
jgi:NAD(P)-dependent dehydrogenase (short-subunit alcohol dehydrogenase family)